jgi:hypothetical protein
MLTQACSYRGEAAVAGLMPFFATDALEACRRRQLHDITRVTVQPLILHRQINRLPTKQLGKTAPREIGCDIISAVVAARIGQPSSRPSDMVSSCR